MRYLYILLTYLALQFTHAQSIDSGEYFFDIDPGLGNGTSLPINTNSGMLTQSYSISISALSEGFHSLYIRTQNSEGNWSHYDRSSLYIANFSLGQDIIAAEYFFDTDSGIGTGASLPVNPNSGELTQGYSISTSSLSEGFHSLYIRTQVADLTWSLYDRAIIYINDFSELPADVVSAEYFIDGDPGIGNGTSFSITDTIEMLNFDTTGLADGDHLFCVRVQNADGIWSLYDCEIFTIDPNLSIEDYFYESITLYPNPIVNSVSIKSTELLNIEKIVIYNMQGKIVLSQESTSDKINMESFLSGIYILELHANNSKMNFKIIKK